MSHLFLRFWAVFLMCWLLSACRAAPGTEYQSDLAVKPGAKTLVLGDITGPAAQVLILQIKRVFSQNPNLALVSEKKPTPILSGKTTLEIKDTPGSDLVKTPRESAAEKEITIRDPFVDQDFWIRKKVPSPTADQVPFIQRQGLMTLTYTLNTPGQDPANNTKTITAHYTRKFGGINQQLPQGPKLENLPRQEETIKGLARQLALKLSRNLVPEAGGKFVPELDLGPDPLAESPTAEGVRLAKAGLWKEGVRVWKNILTYDPEHPAANYNIGVFYESQDEPPNLEKARQYYARAIKTGNNPLYRQALTRVTVALRHLKNQGPGDGDEGNEDQ